MFGKKKPELKDAVDRDLMRLIYQTRDRMNGQRRLIASFREVDRQTRAQMHLQEVLFDFLHREARARVIKSEIVAEMAAKQIQSENEVLHIKS